MVLKIATRETVQHFDSILAAIQNQVDQFVLQNGYSNLTPNSQNGFNPLMEN
jgi:hypothetical protein